MIGFSYSPPVISSIRLENLEVSANAAKQAAEDASLQTQVVLQQVREYRNEAEYYFTQVQQIQEGDYVTTQSLSDTLGAFGFDDLANVPAAFVPVAHGHLWADITDKPAEFKPAAHLHKWADITDKPVEFEPAEHVHTWQQIAEKPGTFPPESHFHSWDEIENKPAKFNPVAHQHSWADVTGKPLKFPSEAHFHTWDQIKDKPDVFHTGNSVNAGEYGLGNYGSALPFNDLTQNLKNGLYKCYSVTHGMTVQSGDSVMRTNYAEGNNGRMLAFGLKNIYYRTQDSSGVWGREEEVLNTGVFDWVRNDSGQTISPNYTVSGGGVSPSKFGTWKNCSASAVGPGQYGLFMRV